MTIAINNLSFAYRRISALANVTVRADPGRIVAVLGPNAAGKSTLLRCIIGALKPTNGAVLLDGNPVHHLTAHALAQRIAYVPQRSTVSATFTVRQVVELGRYALPSDPRRVTEAIARLDLLDVGQRLYRTLSVGQQQRVTLARAMAQLSASGVLVLDEPTSAMDLAHINQSHWLLREIANAGTTVIMAVHDLPLAAAVANESWLLQDGRLVAAGPTCDVLEAQRLRQVFGVGFAWMNDGAGRPRLLAELPVP